MQPFALLLMTPDSTASLWGEYLKTVSVLIGICMLAMVAAKLILPRLRATRPGAGRIRVLASHPLEPKKSLYIVKAGNTAILLATSGAAVHFLTELDESAGLEVEPLEESNRGTSALAFRNITRFVRERYSRPQL